MGKLLIDIGALTATKQIANAKAKLIVDGFVAAQGGPVTGTEQEKMDWFIERISEYVRDVYRRHKREVAIVEAQVAADATTETWD